MNYSTEPHYVGVPGASTPYYEGVPSAAFPQSSLKPRPNDQPGWYTEASIVTTVKTIPFKELPINQPIVKGQAIWTARSIDKDPQRLTTVTINQLNEILRIGWVKGLSILENSLPELKTCDEESWFGTRHDILTKMNANSNMRSLKYMCKQGILDMWNYFGIVSNVGLSDSNFKYQSQLLNVHVSLLGFSKCYWDNLRTDMRCGFILKRSKEGPFQVVPWISDGQHHKPTMAELRYQDLAGINQYGHYWYVGKIVRIENDNRQRPDERMWKGTPDESLSACKENTINLLLDLSRDMWCRSD
jgi:hypothetical protein